MPCGRSLGGRGFGQWGFYSIFECDFQEGKFYNLAVVFLLYNTDIICCSRCDTDINIGIVGSLHSFAIPRKLGSDELKLKVVRIKDPRISIINIFLCRI